MILLADYACPGACEAAASDWGAGGRVGRGRAADLLVMISILYFGIYVGVSHSVAAATDGARASGNEPDWRRGAQNPDGRRVDDRGSQVFPIDGERIEVERRAGADEALPSRCLRRFAAPRMVPGKLRGVDELDESKGRRR